MNVVLLILAILMFFISILIPHASSDWRKYEYGSAEFNYQSRNWWKFYLCLFVSGILFIISVV